jgi:hypothetical protein
VAAASGWKRMKRYHLAIYWWATCTGMQQNAQLNAHVRLLETKMAVSRENDEYYKFNHFHMNFDYDFCE